MIDLAQGHVVVTQDQERVKEQIGRLVDDFFPLLVLGGKMTSPASSATFLRIWSAPP